ncbi:MAG TPA: FtsX-like permease family protein, partial [Gaiella sp.]|nr:FtsX-like permease family protein [Gaiella sp.]
LFTYLATVRQPDGTFRTLELGDAQARRATVLTATLPPAARGGHLVSLTLRPPRLNDRGADSGVALRGGTIVRIPGVALDDWIGLGGVDVARTSRSDALAVRYAVTYQRVARLRPRQPTDVRPPAAVVTPRLGELAGGAGGTLPLRIGGEPVTVRVAGVVDRIPGTTGDAVVVDGEALRTAVDADAPGRAPVSELWLHVAGGEDTAVEAALARPPFAVLATTSRARAEADASRDPLAHGTLLALGAAALVALALAVAGLVLAVRADLRDDRGELADLEAQGAAPRLLRRTVVARASMLAAVGVAGGILAGAILAVLVTRVVSVTARADAPEPPLVTSVDPVLLLVGALAAAAVAAALVALTTRRAFASPRGPGRIGGEA